MNRLHRFLYWNMGYHVEHHMFPLVPYHALPKLHEAVKDDCPPAYPSLWVARKEIVPTLMRQAKDPAYCVQRKLPERHGEPRLDEDFFRAAAPQAFARDWQKGILTCLRQATQTTPVSISAMDRSV